MGVQVHGELIPIGGGDNIPLLRDALTVGRRESCDICMRFPNISGQHCELTFRNGYWYIRDLQSTNGVKVNDKRVDQKLLHPGDKITFGKRPYTIQYSLPANQNLLDEVDADEIMGQSLLEKAGLERPKPKRKKGDTIDDIDPGEFLLRDE